MRSTSTADASQYSRRDGPTVVLPVPAPLSGATTSGHYLSTSPARVLRQRRGPETRALSSHGKGKSSVPFFGD